MTSALSRPIDAEAIAGLNRRQYVEHKLRADVKSIGIIFLVCWVLEFASRSMAYLAAADLFILALAGLDHARQWDRGHQAANQPPGA